MKEELASDNKGTFHVVDAMVQDYEQRIKDLRLHWEAGVRTTEVMQEGEAREDPRDSADSRSEEVGLQVASKVADPCDSADRSREQVDPSEVREESDSHVGVWEFIRMHGLFNSDGDAPRPTLMALLLELKDRLLQYGTCRDAECGHVLCRFQWNEVRDYIEADP